MKTVKKQQHWCANHTSIKIRFRLIKATLHSNASDVIDFCHCALHVPHANRTDSILVQQHLHFIINESPMTVWFNDTNAAIVAKHSFDHWIDRTIPDRFTLTARTFAWLLTWNLKWRYRREKIHFTLFKLFFCDKYTLVRLKRNLLGWFLLNNFSESPVVWTI